MTKFYAASALVATSSMAIAALVVCFLWGCSGAPDGGSGGASVETCPTLPNTKPGTWPACLIECAKPFADCDGDPANGCEANLELSPNCGGCGVSCSAAQACATGCNETYSCTPSPTNCPRCSRAPSADTACSDFNELYPIAQSCETVAPMIAGCILSPFGANYECCPALDGG